MELITYTLSKTSKKCLIPVSIVFFCSILSLLIFNAYAQQGGAATGGNAQGGTAISGSSPCYGTCYYYGGPSIGGAATGGNANINLSKQQSHISSSIAQTNISTNKAPIANTGIKQEVNEGDIVLLNGSKSYDPDGDPITFSWKEIQGPFVKLYDANSSSIFFSAPNVSADSKLIFELTVKDDKGLKGTSIVTITDKHNASIASTISNDIYSNTPKQIQTCSDGSQTDPNGNCPIPIENIFQ